MGGEFLYTKKRKNKKDFNDLFKKRSTNFNLCYVFKQLGLLKGPGFLQSLFHKSSAVSRVLPFEGGQIKYAAFEGSLYIDEIQITGPLGVDAKHPAGTYKVKKDQSDAKWKPYEKSNKVNQVSHVDTKHLAINGNSSSLSDAADYMPVFIEHGFGEKSLNNTYSLFYTPTKNVANSAYKALSDDLNIKDLESAKKLASVFEQLSKKDQEVSLTVHGSGNYVFKSALKKLKQQNLKLPNVTVYYANSTANLESVDQERKQAGMKLHDKAPLINPVSLQQNYFSGNIISSPIIAARSTPKDKVSIAVNTFSSGLPKLHSPSFYIGLAAGSAPSLERKKIENIGQAAGASAQLVWDSVHKMMVRG